MFTGEFKVKAKVKIEVYIWIEILELMKTRTNVLKS